MIYTNKGPIKTSHEGLMIANGSLGALIYGTDNLTISLDRIDLWDNRLPKEYRDKDFNYEHLLDVLANNYDDYKTLFGKCYGHPYPSKINAGMFVFDYKVSDDDIFSLNVDNATFKIEGKNIDFEGYIDANHNVMVYTYNKELDFSIKMAPYFTKKVSKGGLGYKPYTVEEEGNITIIRQHMYGKHEYGIVIYKTIQNDKVKLLVSIYKNKDLENTIANLKDYLINQQTYFAEHNEYWKNYYGTSSIVTPDAKVNELYQWGRYYFGCNSRRDYPMTLQGAWTRNNGELPPWKADLHFDLNVQMTYDAFMKLGNFAEGRVLSDWMWNHRKKFAKIAKDFMHTDGWMIGGCSSADGEILGGWPQYSMNPSCAIWAIKTLYDYYVYTNDKKFLKKRVYPFFENIEKSVFEVLETDSEGYYQQKVLHASAEYFENDPKSIFKHQTNYELTMLRYLYEKLIEMGKLLKKDTLHYEDVLSHLRDYYRDERGLLVISPDQKVDMSHRHISHMLMYKEMELVDPFINKDVIFKDVDHFASFGPSHWIGFSPVEVSGLYSMAQAGNQAYKHLKDFEYYAHPNGFHMNTDYKRQGYTEFGPYCLTLETNIGYTKSLADMMVLNYHNKVAVFPGICDKFISEGVEFKDLRLIGGHKVSGYRKGDSESFEIKLNKRSKIELLNNFAENPVLEIDGVKKSIKSKLGKMIKISAKQSIKFAK